MAVKHKLGTGDSIDLKNVNKVNQGVGSGLDADQVDGKHAPSGNIVGTTDAQTLTNKTIDANQNTLLNLSSASITDRSIKDNHIDFGLGAGQVNTDDLPEGTANKYMGNHPNVSSAVHGVTGSIVGTTDAQELSNKTLNNPRIKDVDVTPVGDTLLKTIDGVLQVRNTTDTATARLRANLLQDGTYVDVRAFGAVGDGTTDDRAAIQAAIDNSEGRAVYIPQGNYRINGSLNITRENTLIFGDGMGIGGGNSKSIIRPSGAINAIYINAKRAMLRDLSIDGTASTLNGIVFSGAGGESGARAIFERVEIRNVRGNPGYGINGAGGQWLCTFDKLFINNCNIGFYLDGTNYGYQGTVIRDSLVQGNIQENIHLKSSTGRPNSIWLQNVDVEQKGSGTSAVRKGIVIEHGWGPIYIENPYYEHDPENPGANDPNSLFLEVLNASSTSIPHIYVLEGRLGGSNGGKNCIKIIGNAKLFVTDTLFDRWNEEVIAGIGGANTTVELRNTRIRTGKLYGVNYSDTTFTYLKDESGVRYAEVNNKLGIGTDSPSGRLHVKGAANEKQLIVQANSTQTSNLLEVQDSAGNALTTIDGVGYLKPLNVASLPTASASYRGKVVRVEGGTGVSDKLYVCEKTSADGYAWRALSDPASIIGSSEIKDNQIDFGLGAGQVNTNDVPEGSANKYFSGKTLDNLPDGTNFKRTSASEKDALAGTSGIPSATNKFVTDSDPRNTNARTPVAHASSHAPGGSDALGTGVPGNQAIGDAASEGVATTFARSDHKHGMPATGTAVDLGNANAEGTSSAVARADHVHKRDVRVAKDGIDIGTRNKLNFTGANVTVTDDGVNDKVDVNIAGGAGSDTKVGVFANGVQVGTDARKLDIRNDGDINFTITEDTTNDQFDIKADIKSGVIVDDDIAASGITTRSKLPAAIAYEDEANTFTQANTFQNNQNFTGTIRVPRKTDPASSLTGELWVTGKDLKYRDNQGIPATQLVEVQSNKGQPSGYASLDASTLVPLAQIPATLIGKDADSVDGSHGADLEKVINKGQANGYASLDVSGLVPLAQTPAHDSSKHTVASAVNLGNTNAEGTSSAVARADHVHKRDVRVAKDGTDAGTRNRINFVGNVHVTDDSTNDKLDINIPPGVFFFRRVSTNPEFWYSNEITATGHTDLSISAGVLYATPYICGRNRNVTKISINVRTAGAANTKARVGIYEDDGDMYPGNLLLDAGEVDVATTGVKTINISQPLIAGKLYWLAVISNGTPSIRGNTGSAAFCIGINTALMATIGFYNASQSYGTLPSAYPPGNNGASGTTPLIALKLS